MSSCESTPQKLLRVEKAISVAAVLKRHKHSVRGECQKEESSPLEFALTQTFHNLLKEIEQDSEYIHSEEKSPLESSSSFLESTSSSKDLLNSTQEHLSLPSPTLEEIQNLSESDSVSSIGGICLSTQEDSDTSEVPPWSPKRHIQFEDCEISQINFCDDPETTGTLLSSPKLQFKNSLISNIKFIEDSLEEDIEMAEAKKKKLKKLKASIDTKLSTFTVEDIHEESIDTYKQDQANILASLEQLNIELADAEDILEDADFNTLENDYNTLIQNFNTRKREVAAQTIVVRRRIGLTSNSLESVSSAASTPEGRALKKAEAKYEEFIEDCAQLSGDVTEHK